MPKFTTAGALRAVLGLVSLLSLTSLVVAAGAQPAQAQSAEPVKLRVEITDTGFNGKPGELTLEVDQGALVDLTFAWAHAAYPSEEHIMVLDGYKLEWDRINAQHREATVKFIADKVGTFNFKCDEECALHSQLQRGFLKVRPAGAGGPGGAGSGTARTPTSLSLTPSSKTAGDRYVSLMAVLKDEKGAPVPKAEVRFFEDAEFVGTKGPMEIGLAKTDGNGVAFLDYQPTLDRPGHTITAQFEGMGLYDESKQSVEIQQVGAPALGYTPDGIGLDALRQWAPLGLSLVILAVWGTFGFVLWQIAGIARRAGGETGT